MAIVSQSGGVLVDQMVKFKAQGIELSIGVSIGLVPITPNLTDVTVIARACEQASADGICLAGAQLFFGDLGGRFGAGLVLVARRGLARFRFGAHGLVGNRDKLDRLEPACISILAMGFDALAEDRPFKVVHRYEDSFTAMIPAHWIRRGCTCASPRD